MRVCVCVILIIAAISPIHLSEYFYLYIYAVSNTFVWIVYGFFIADSVPIQTAVHTYIDSIPTPFAAHYATTMPKINSSIFSYNFLWHAYAIASASVNAILNAHHLLGFWANLKLYFNLMAFPFANGFENKATGK